MTDRAFALTAEFCDLVGAKDLLTYLGLPESASSDAVKSKLKARRKYMQGMQSNPKYKKEAMFLIKNFSSLNTAVRSPDAYLVDARQRAESQHLPVLEMTIKGVLSGGTLNYDQEDYLRRNALELGVSEATFESVIERLANAADVQRANDRLVISETELQTTDFYQLLGVSKQATRDEIYGQYREKAEASKRLSDAPQREAARTRVEKAWKVLSDSSRRKAYDLAWSRTGPPARNRDVPRKLQSSTAPPVLRRAQIPPTPPSPLDETVERVPQRMAAASPPKLELLSRRAHSIRVGDEAVTIAIEVRNSGDGRLTGTVRSSSPWLEVLTPTLDGDAKQQSIRVRIKPEALGASKAEGTLSIAADQGGSESVTFSVQRTTRPLWLPAVVGGLIALVVLGGLAYAWFGASEDRRFTVRVDPWAEVITVDGREVGNGQRIVIENPPPVATLKVRHGSFKSYVKDIEFEPGGELQVRLELARKLDFKPKKGKNRGKLDEQKAVQAMHPFKPALDRCLRGASVDASGVSGLLRIYVGQDGHPMGYDLDSKAATSPGVRKCLEPQIAAPLFPPFEDGDYVTVRYDFSLPAP